MLPNPSYAPDAQLRSMAQGGLPSAINEEIQRLALRRGARAVPQQPMPQAPPQVKMSAEDMIRDFVQRVRQQNEEAAQSLVPIGTPQPQHPKAPPQGGPPSVPQGQPDQPKGFRDGGVLDGNRYFGAPPRSVPAAPPAKEEWAGPLFGDGQMWHGIYEEDSPNGIFNGKNARNQQNIPGLKYPGEGIAAAPNVFDPFGQTPLAEGWKPAARPVLDNPSGSGIAAVATGIAVPERTKMGKLPDRVQFNAPEGPGEYITPERVDPLAERERMIKNNKGKIRDARKPYDDAAAEASADLEESKRKSFFRGLVEAGVAAMQAGGPSTDPASGDFMSIAGASIGQYVQSLDRDKAYQERLKDKITNYKIGGGEAQTRAEDRFSSLGMAAAESQNAFNVADAAGHNNYNMGIAGLDMQKANAEYQGEVSQRASEIGAMIAQYQTDASFDLASFKHSLDLEVAKITAASGLDPKILQQIGANAEQAAAAAYNAFLQNSNFKEETDETKKAKILEGAQAAYVGTKASSYLDQLQNMRQEVNPEAMMEQVRRNATGMAPATSKVQNRDPKAPPTFKTGFPGAPAWNSYAPEDTDIIDYRQIPTGISNK